MGKQPLTMERCAKEGYMHTDIQTYRQTDRQTDIHPFVEPSMELLVSWEWTPKLKVLWSPVSENFISSLTYTQLENLDPHGCLVCRENRRPNWSIFDGHV